LLFPTKFEGFGWLWIEAQACGCPVISATALQFPRSRAMPALLRAPEDEPGFVADVLRLRDSNGPRDARADAGRENVKRFTPERMVDAYVDLYQQLCARSGN
jgi:glycosyltransferase involved in cell wall biosynthesis